VATAFLFGAGASYGSDFVGTPPLGNALHAALATFDPMGWGNVGRHLAAEFSRDFERAMAAVPQHAIPPLQRAMAAYFFQFNPGPQNLYLDLARRIRQHSPWQGSLSTLNYDRLLELSLVAAGVNPFIGPMVNRPPEVEMCMPHGCCHLFCEGARGVASAVSFAAFNVEINGPISVIGDPAIHRARLQQDAFPPVMSYFEPNKKTTAGADFIRDQRARWAQIVHDATTIIVVGVAVRSHDRHIWDPIGTTKGRVVYCGGPLGGAEFDAWAAAQRGGKQHRTLYGYFRDEIQVIYGEAGI
jgi:hypothetical protein